MKKEEKCERIIIVIELAGDPVSLGRGREKASKIALLAIRHKLGK